MRRLLTIAGSDSGGGAGIQADLKTFHAFGAYGMSALTLVTVQNTRGVESVHFLPPALVAAQIRSVARDLGVEGAKTGALGKADIIEAVSYAVKELGLAPLVVDPVMVSRHGSVLVAPDAVDAMRKRMVPLATLLTPNLHEAAALCGREVQSEAGMADAARALCDLGAKAVLVKGGALSGDEAVDVLFDGAQLHRVAAPRVRTRHTHGSGCTYSAALAALLAEGLALTEAVFKAKAYVGRAIATAPGFGEGAGPLNHFA
jgi:hydroxymethylpyrimidine/phosphomethylpyrimidine kinase